MSVEGCGNSAAESISSLDDQDLLGLLQSVLQERTGVLQALVAWAVPGFVYIPSKAITDHRIRGTVKSCAYDQGFGSISCPEVQEVFDCDVLLHASQAASVQIGDVVNFAVLLNKDQKPQAFDVLPGEPGAGKGGSSWSGEADEWWGEAKGASWSGKGGKSWSAELSPANHPMASPTASPPMAAAPAAHQPERIPPAAPQPGRHPMAAPSPGKGAPSPGKGAPWPEEANGYGRDAWEASGVHVPVPPLPPAPPSAQGKPPSGAMEAPSPGKGAPWPEGAKGYGKGHGGAKGKPPGGAMEGVTDRRFEGSVKSFNHGKGFGFICCEELQGIFGQGVDVFTHHAQIGEFAVGDQVSFAVVLNRDSKPQAMDLWPAADAAKRSRWS